MNILKTISYYLGKYMSLVVITVAISAYFFPPLYKWVLQYINYLLGIIMFGMGMTLTKQDFIQIAKKPTYILAGTLLQYTVMPLLGFALAKIFGLNPMLAAGIILVGTCPGGTSSNVMTYLAKGDVALSVSMTTVSTLLSPILTPLLTLLLAGKMVDVNAASMFFSIIKIVLVPIALGFILNMYFHNTVSKALDILPAISVIAIVLIVGGVVSAQGPKILTYGPIVFLAVIMHNLFGYTLGYLAGKLLKMPERSSRTISIEVGMQNSGLAAGLATKFFSPEAALPGAVFSLWHNISGSLYANYLHKKQLENEAKSEN